MGNHLFFLTLQIFNTIYSISSFISSEVKLNLSLLVFLTGHVSILIRVLIMIWFAFINYDSFMSLSFMLFILLAATCEYVFLWILVFMSFNLSLYTGHPAHAALWAPPQFIHFHLSLLELLLQFVFELLHLGHLSCCVQLLANYQMYYI